MTKYFVNENWLNEPSGNKNCTPKFEISELAKLLLFEKHLSKAIFIITRSAFIYMNSRTALCDMIVQHI